MSYRAQRLGASKQPFTAHVVGVQQWSGDPNFYGIPREEFLEKALKLLGVEMYAFLKDMSFSSRADIPPHFERQLLQVRAAIIADRRAERMRQPDIFSLD